jgi:hypothetical protein
VERWPDIFFFFFFSFFSPLISFSHVLFPMFLYEVMTCGLVLYDFLTTFEIYDI